MLDSLKFAMRMIKANPRPYAAIVAGSTAWSVVSMIAFNKLMMSDNKYTLFLTQEMYDLLRASEGPIYFDMPDMTLRLHFDH